MGNLYCGAMLQMLAAESLSIVHYSVLYGGCRLSWLYVLLKLSGKGVYAKVTER